MSESSEALKVENISKHYQENPVLDRVSLTVRSGEVFGLVGPNGAGKTTLMKIIAGLTKPSQGTIAIFGREALAERGALKQLLGWVPQDNNLERELTVRESLTLYARLFGVKSAAQRVRAVMSQFELDSFSEKKVDLLSGGMARRVLIARAVLPEPPILLLDEPTVGLDPDVRQEVWQVVRSLSGSGKTVFMTTHYMDEADQLCARLAFLQDGRVRLQGTPAEIKAMAGGEQAKLSLEAAFLYFTRKGSGKWAGL